MIALLTGWGADVVECLTETGGEILLVPNGSPYSVKKNDERMQIAIARVVENHAPKTIGERSSRRQFAALGPSTLADQPHVAWTGSRERLGRKWFSWRLP